ncbi:MAG: hypothetical protein L6Q49_22210 [Anaerolineales bacterium]|nr:hypothetical protein [Anaerolineales bacterium]
MDRNFYHQKRAEEHQREISRELANHHMLEGLKREPLSRKQAQRLVLRLAITVIVFSAILAFL